MRHANFGDQLVLQLGYKFVNLGFQLSFPLPNLSPPHWIFYVFISVELCLYIKFDTMGPGMLAPWYQEQLYLW
jgi:hypothetical protein